MIKMPFFTSEQPKRYKLWSCQKMCDALYYLLDNIFIRFCSKSYRQLVGIPMGTNCAPLAADLFLFCYERDFMLSLSDNNQADIIGNPLSFVISTINLFIVLFLTITNW